MTAGSSPSRAGGSRWSLTGRRAISMPQIPNIRRRLSTFPSLHVTRHDFGDLDHRRKRRTALRRIARRQDARRRERDGGRGRQRTGVDREGPLRALRRSRPLAHGQGRRGQDQLRLYLHRRRSRFTRDRHQGPSSRQIRRGQMAAVVRMGNFPEGLHQPNRGHSQGSSG